MEESWGEGFTGIPFEGLGSVNDAMHREGADDLLTRLPGFIETGEVITKRELREGSLKTAVILYPSRSPVNFGVLLSSTGPEHQLSVISLYPVLEGIGNRLEVVNYKAWENGLEGMVAADTALGGVLGFFDPFYYYDQWHLKVGSAQSFSLAALAFTLEIAGHEEVVVKSGPFYDHVLKEFLAENPGRTEADFTPPTIIMGSAHMLVPTRYTGEYQFRALVLAAEKFPFMGTEIWRFHISMVIDMEDESATPELWLYAAPHVIRGKTPKTGDYIQGYCWLSGYLSFKGGVQDLEK